MYNNRHLIRPFDNPECIYYAMIHIIRTKFSGPNHTVVSVMHISPLIPSALSVNVHFPCPFLSFRRLLHIDYFFIT